MRALKVASASCERASNALWNIGVVEVPPGPVSAANMVDADLMRQRRVVIAPGTSDAPQPIRPITLPGPDKGAIHQPDEAQEQPPGLLAVGPGDAEHSFGGSPRHGVKPLPDADKAMLHSEVGSCARVGLARTRAHRRAEDRWMRLVAGPG
jgi:hypothetical protein